MVRLKDQDEESAKAHMEAQNGNAHLPVAPPTPSPPVLPPPPFIYPFNQQHLIDDNGNYYWNGEHRPHLYSWPDVNHQLMSNQENLNWKLLVIIKKQNKKLAEKDAQMQKLLAEVASLEAVTQENAHLRAKLHEFGDLETRKQGLELQGFNLEISKLVRAEAENLKDQLEESEKCRINAEEMSTVDIMDSGMNTIVVDMGSANIKAGIACESNPISVFPSIIGRSRHSNLLHLNGADRQDSYIGNEAQSRREMLSISHPIRNRKVTNWDDLIILLDYTFKNKLHLSPEVYKIVSTETFSTPKTDREKMTEIMFERFNVPAYYTAKQATLSLFASCRTTGLVIESGEGGTDIVSIYEGYAIPRTQLSSELGGEKLTDFFGTLLAEKGYTFSTTIVQSIKEQLCYVAPNLEEGMNTAPGRESTYTLPDGQMISVGNQKRRCPEALFRPSLMNMETSGLHLKCQESILKCEPNIRSNMYSNIILSGGSTLFPGLGDRMKNELSKLVPSSTTINVLTSPERAHPVWIGGSILASLVTFQQMFITRRNYEESGSSIVHTKCIH